MSTSIANVPLAEYPDAEKGTGMKFMDGWQRLETRVRILPQWLLLTLVLSTVGVVAWVDFVAPWEFNLTLAYATIVLLATWLGGGQMGLFIALVSTLVAFLANIPSHPYQTVLGHLLANLSRLAFFLCMAICIGAIRKRREADAFRIQMLEEMRHLEQEIVSASEHEQQRIGQDLHDGLCQQLAAIGCAARALADDLQAASQPTAADAINIEKALSQSVQEARSMARGIFPVHVDCSGLSAALADMVEITQRLTGVTIILTETADVMVDDPEVAMHFYRIAQEALANAVRHSGASEVVLALLHKDGFIELRVDDNGKGIAADIVDASQGMGLRTMRYRARSLGADLSIQSRAGGGTSLRCRLKDKPQILNGNGQN